MGFLWFAIWVFSFGFSAGTALAKTVRYELVVSQRPIDLSGMRTVDFALTVNGGIPAPTLEFTEGDWAEIQVVNQIPSGEELSIHWHGILLPPEQDGVAYVNSPPIQKGQPFTFRFQLRQHGTYWYHSHTGLQEQKGVYGAFIVHPKKKSLSYDRDAVVVLSDWSDENADQILRNLRKDGDYYLYKKDSMRSIWGAYRSGGLGNFFYNEWTRMGGMDLSDVGYDAFLINGKRESLLTEIQPGETIRLRIINAAASSYFYISLGDQIMNVVSSDGVDIEPVKARELLIGMAETYDVLFTAPDARSYELRATAQDVTGRASAWIGKGDRVFAAEKPRPDLYARMEHGTDHGSHSESGSPESHTDHGAAIPHHVHQDHSAHHTPAAESAAIFTLTVEDLRAQKASKPTDEARIHNVQLELGGDMERYIWHINGKAIHQDRTIEIREGDTVRFRMVNKTMMHHPMHLHGHFFRVLNKNNSHSPLKHTVDVPPHGTRTIEFVANEPGQWMLHCHNLYHMKTGMARVIKYSTWSPSPEMARIEGDDPHLHDHIYLYGRAEAASNHAQVNMRLSKAWDTFDFRFESRDYAKFNHIEGDALYRRWFSQFTSLVAGGFHYSEFVSQPTRALAGFELTLPILVRSMVLIDHLGEVRVDLEKRLQWTKTMNTDIDLSYRQSVGLEYELTLMYQPEWSWSLGLMLTEQGLGVGANYQF